MENNSNFNLPHRGILVTILVIVLALIWAIFLWKQYVPSRPAGKPVPVLQNAGSEILRQSDGSYIIKWTGLGEYGFRLPDLAPGTYSLKWLDGKIVYSDSGDSFPLSGTWPYREEYRKRLRYSRISGIRPHQVMMVVGRIGSGGEKLFPFRPAESRIAFYTGGREQVSLFYHYISGCYNSEFGWGGNRVTFELRKIG